MGLSCLWRALEATRRKTSYSTHPEKVEAILDSMYLKLEKSKIVMDPEIIAKIDSRL
jgi:hypothetical protein